MRIRGVKKSQHLYIPCAAVFSYKNNRILDIEEAMW